jgi:RNA polymerase sigma factor (sigma-70 family)
MKDIIIEGFDRERERLRAVAFRLLGTTAEADDAVQEAWLRLNSTDAAGIVNLQGWLTTVVSRIALDMLRARKSRREDELTIDNAEPAVGLRSRSDPEQEALLAEAVGIGLMVILDRLEPPERIAFVLHDIFGVNFGDIAPIVDRSPVAARQLASRARRRIRGGSAQGAPSIDEQRRVVSAFFAASRQGDFEALLELLDPDATLKVDFEGSPGAPSVTEGASIIAKRAQLGAAAQGRWSELMLVDGAAGIVVAPFGQIRLIMQFKLIGSRIRQIDIVTEQRRLAGLQIGLIDIA